jgi:hypothetical protein
MPRRWTNSGKPKSAAARKGLARHRAKRTKKRLARD